MKRMMLIYKMPEQSIDILGLRPILKVYFETDREFKEFCNELKTKLYDEGFVNTDYASIDEGTWDGSSVNRLLLGKTFFYNEDLISIIDIPIRNEVEIENPIIVRRLNEETFGRYDSLEDIKNIRISKLL